jgi:hypothetical protein
MKRSNDKSSYRPLLLPLFVLIIVQTVLPGCSGDKKASTEPVDSGTPVFTLTEPPVSTPAASKPVISQTPEGPPPATLLQEMWPLFYPLDGMPAVDPRKMWQDYQTDPTAAIAKYEGKTFHFPNVVVEKMPYMGEGYDLEFYVQTGMVKFRTEIFEVLWPIREGFTVDIIGTVTGMKWNYLNVSMAYVVVTDPPGGLAGGAPPPEY